MREKILTTTREKTESARENFEKNTFRENSILIREKGKQKSHAWNENVAVKTMFQ